MDIIQKSGIQDEYLLISTNMMINIRDGIMDEHAGHNSMETI